MCKCALAFVGLVVAFLAELAVRAARAPVSTTLPELVVGRPRSAEALDPPAHPRVPLPLDVAAVALAT